MLEVVDGRMLGIVEGGMPEVASGGMLDVVSGVIGFCREFTCADSTAS
jgi:hypothetical protein